MDIQEAELKSSRLTEHEIMAFSFWQGRLRGINDRKDDFQAEHWASLEGRQAKLIVVILLV
jgi:hypothetical protein